MTERDQLISQQKILEILNKDQPIPETVNKRPSLKLMKKIAFSTQFISKVKNQIKNDIIKNNSLELKKKTSKLVGNYFDSYEGLNFI